MKKAFLFSILLIITTFTYAQVNLDSLWGIWNDKSQEDTSRLKAINRIVWDTYLFSQPDSADYFAQMMYDQANIKDLKEYMANALNIQGVSYAIRNNYSKALDYFHQVLEIQKEISNNQGISTALSNIGRTYKDQGDYLKALDYYQQCLKISAEISDKKGLAKTMNSIGLIYASQGDYPKALNYYQKCLKISEEISDNLGLANTLNNIGIIYLRLGNYSKALVYYQRSLKYREEISDERQMANTLGNIGLIYSHQGDYFKAMAYYQRSLKIFEEDSYKLGIANTFDNIGLIYSNQGDYDKAMDYFQRSLKIKNGISDNKGIANSFNNIGELSNTQGNHAKAIIWCKKGLLIAEEINILLRQKNACKCLYDAYKALGNDKQALKYHEKMLVLNDSLQAEETSKKLQQMEFQKQMLADSLKEEEEKLKFQHAHELEIHKKNRTRNIYLASGLFVVLIAAGLYRRLRYIRKSKASIEKEKDRSDSLLLNILPSEIAEELKEKGRAEARDFDMVSILFTDFNEFTKSSSSMNAHDLVAEINSCYEAFDQIIEKFGVEKIKTIGDSYMAAGGLPIPSNDSVINTVQVAIEMQTFITERKEEKTAMGKSCFEMRVGIHTGPVVAGIVGVKKFQYDVWGDTVNIASRMEQNSGVGKVNISHDTYELIKGNPLFAFESRGKIDVKGKGEMEMYYVSQNFSEG